MTISNSEALTYLQNPFWDFSISTYGNSRVQEITHSLQDNEGANVNLLLYCCWLAFHVERLSQEEFNKACQTVFSWQQDVTTNLRQARRAITELGKENKDWVDRYLKQVLNVEILSESYQQQLLYSAVKDKDTQANNNDINLAANYLVWLFELMGRPIKEEHRQLFSELANSAKG
ncbi:TIGR02444 family protein [Legionella sp. 16cNR16C]|uniref:TIGR02444 family protein n=1 Tax=Legionella sp. 16cNR16C TaxID=2905656 RepID=UPI001E5356C5|nr:TIGR02444 family protein [Legionella sp. 16cNR16C]MCE3043827.1 TIGR02444 family protein [Legionella sp. 16cNR16C]